MNKVQEKRLLNVARALREAHAAKKFFDMKSIFKENRDNEFELIPTKDGWCGTPACAWGHYVSRPDLQKKFRAFVDVHKDVVVRRSDDVGRFGTTVCYDDPQTLDHFGIDCEEADDIFSAYGCDEAKTPLQAAKFIERFVADKRKHESKRP